MKIKQRFYFEEQTADVVSRGYWDFDDWDGHRAAADAERLAPGRILVTVHPAALVYDIIPGFGGMLTAFKQTAAELENHGHHAAAAYLLELAELPNVKRAGRDDRYGFRDDGMTAVYNGKPWSRSIKVDWSGSYWAITMAIAKEV